MTVDPSFISFAHHLADAAGAAIRPYFNTALEVSTKADQSPVSIADREAEAAMRSLIEAQYPAHGVYGEEFGQSGTTSPSREQYTWVLDPIDGTRAFLAGSTQWGTLIALCKNGIPILGILDQPITRERWVGANTVTHYARATNDHAISTRPCPSLQQASISTTSHRYFSAPQAIHFAKLAEQCGEVIANGDCYAYGLLARGKRDIVVDAGLKPYDILALVPIIEGAGGVITGWDGAAVTLSNYAHVVAAGDAARHQETLDILGKSV